VLFPNLIQPRELPFRSFFNAVDGQASDLVTKEEIVTLLPKIEALFPQMH
jgi:hypothetical protein